MLHSRRLVLVISTICLIALGSWGGIMLINKTREVHTQTLTERTHVETEALVSELPPGEYTFEICVEIDDKDYGTVRCITKVLE